MDYNAIYIGQTRRTFDQRLKEHKKNYKNSSSFGNHLSGKKNYTTAEEVKFLHIQPKSGIR